MTSFPRIDKIVLSILIVVFCQVNLSAQRKDSFPNIVFIFADDLGYGDLGCFGATDIKTPNIDRLAKEGIKFTDFYSASSVCSPSRAALLTGRYPQRMGINNVFFPESFTGMPQSEITMAELLKEKDYSTGIIGKWHLGHREKFLPLQQGFDYYFGIPYSNDMSSVVYMRGNKVVDYYVDQRETTKTYTREALNFIEKNKNSPFFLYVAHNMPHVPIHASKDFRNKSQRGLYGDVIEELDWSVGSILTKLESFGLLENTLVIFSSDNGPWLVMEEHGGSAGILKEGKQFTFEGGMRVPTVAMWKKRIKPRTVYSGLATQMDWFPTFAHLLGISLPDDRPIDGSDISKVLFQHGKREGDAFLFLDGSRLQGFRKGMWKIKKPYRGTRGSPWQKAVAAHDTLLFDLRKDPGETKNLYLEKKSFTRELFSKMEQAYQQLGPLPESLIVTTGKDNSHFEYLKGKKE
nr:sulfatase [Allomuricauda sp.]